jgi:V8-like Glu-specific endopeptidase
MNMHQQPNTEALQRLFQQERKAELKQRKAKAQQPSKKEEADLSQSVSNQEAIGGMKAESEFGSLGQAETVNLEVVAPSVQPSLTEAAEHAAEAVQPLDAYWGSFGSPVARAMARTSSPVMEVVIGSDDRVQVSRTNEYPWRCIASLLITAADGTSWIGTAWLVAPRLLLTAGHCVYMHNQGGWVNQIEVIPGRNGIDRPFGSCIANNVRSVLGWTNNRDRNYDYAAILLPENCRYGDQLGWFGYAVKGDDELKSLTINLSGYPGDKPTGTQWFHSRALMDVDERVLTYDTDTAGGQSGAPVWIRTQDGNRYGVGIHTNGDLAGNSATRINQEVFNNIVSWLAEVP